MRKFKVIPRLSAVLNRINAQTLKFSLCFRLMFFPAAAGSAGIAWG